jgi:hypothetical protein
VVRKYIGDFDENARCLLCPRLHIVNSDILWSMASMASVQPVFEAPYSLDYPQITTWQAECTVIRPTSVRVSRRRGEETEKTCWVVPRGCGLRQTIIIRLQLTAGGISKVHGELAARSGACPWDNF